MGMTIDHLCVDHRVTVLRDFTDANGLTLRAGASGVIRALSFDPGRLEIGIEMERETEKVSLLFWLKNPAGPRLGQMKDFFEVGDDVTTPRAAAAFIKAVDWMATYAGWATSGGEGAALSMERDDFHAALVREFGYDPTEREIRELEK